MSDTPRTSEEWRRIQRLPDGRYSSQITDEDLAHGMCNFAKQLERELAAQTTLAEGRLFLLNSQEARHKREIAQSKDANAGLMKACDSLERELAEARSMTEKQWLLKMAARLVTAGCKSDSIVDAMDELIQQRDTLAEALRGPVNAAKAADSPSWSEPGESGWYVEEYERTNAKNWLANTKNWLPEAIEALAAVKGGEA